MIDMVRSGMSVPFFPSEAEYTAKTELVPKPVLVQVVVSVLWTMPPHVNVARILERDRTGPSIATGGATTGEGISQLLKVR